MEGCPLLFAKPFGEQSQPCRGTLKVGGFSTSLKLFFWGGS